MIFLSIFYLLMCFRFSILCIFPADTTLNPSSYSLWGCRVPKCRRCFPFYWGRVCIICLLFLACIVGFIKTRIVPVRLFKNLFVINNFYMFSILLCFLPFSQKWSTFLSAYFSLMAAIFFFLISSASSPKFRFLPCFTFPFPISASPSQDPAALWGFPQGVVDACSWCASHQQWCTLIIKGLVR